MRRYARWENPDADPAPERRVGPGRSTPTDGLGRDDRAVMVDRLSASSSSIGAMLPSFTERERWTAPSSFCSSRKAPTSLSTASSVEEVPTMSARRLISPFLRVSGLVEHSMAPCAAGKVIQTRACSSASPVVADIRKWILRPFIFVPGP